MFRVDEDQLCRYFRKNFVCNRQGHLFDSCRTSNEVIQLTNIFGCYLDTAHVQHFNTCVITNKVPVSSDVQGPRVRSNPLSAKYVAPLVRLQGSGLGLFLRSLPQSTTVNVL